MSRGTDIDRIDRLERLLSAIYRDGAVRGVLWSQETSQLLFEMQRDRVLEHTSSEIGHG